MLQSSNINSGDHSINAIAKGNVTIYANAPTELIDDKISEEIEVLRKSRFFQEFDSKTASLRISTSILDGDFSGGSSSVKSWALAWCIRPLSLSKNFDVAERLLSSAKTFNDSAETKIAEAFILAHKEEKSSALQLLTSINSNASRSAALTLTFHHDGAEKTLTWWSTVGYKTEDLDADGKSNLLLLQLQLNNLDEAKEIISKLSDADFEETPVLHHLVALVMLVTTIPQDYRAFAMNHPPFEAKSFPLASDKIAIDARRAAHQYFLAAKEGANQLGLMQAKRVDDEYALWLELRDPKQNIDGKKRLEKKLTDPTSALAYVNYAIQFGVKLDLEKVEQKIDQSIAINGGMTSDAATARFALAFTRQNPAEIAKYIELHYDQLISNIDSKLIRFCQIEMLSRSGAVEKANKILEELLEDGILAEQESNLRRLISDSQGNSNPIESRKAQYNKTKALNDLINLVMVLEENQYWEDLCEFGRLLFEETLSLEDAGCFANALSNAHKSKELVEFLEANTSLLPQSYLLHMLYAWGLYHEGMFVKCQAVLEDLKSNADKEDYRSLQVNLWIATGDWSYLSTHVISEYKSKDSRTAQSLINTAQLALQIDLHIVKDLVTEAIKKANGDPAVFISAYHIASSAGWEDDPDVSCWLQNAIEHSDDNGPIQQITLKDLFDRKPEWENRDSQMWSLLSEGLAPIFMVAQSLNRSTVDLTIFPAYANINESDPRRRTLISAYSGKRTPAKFDISEKIIALDATALLTLSFLDILDVVLDIFKTVYVPHSTLGWLFQERHKAKFHQPSRIENAHKVRNFLATGFLEKFIPSTIANSELANLVGIELAELIAEAEKVDEGETPQRIVVCSAPVHRASSLMEEEADLSRHSAVLSSCLAVVEKLRQKGQITVNEKNQARNYLKLREKAWPKQPDIADGAILYLDDLAISYFLHMGLLGKLKAAGLTAVASPREVNEADNLIAYEKISGDVDKAIERIRTSLSSRIASGNVKFGRLLDSKEFAGDSFLQHPSAGILSLAIDCDIAIIDDRALNKNSSINDEGKQAFIYSTLDLLDTLVELDILTGHDCLEYKTRLRRAGYLFIPAVESELSLCLNDALVSDGKVVETAELKAIRESILRVRMSNWLQLPDEVPWLDCTLKSFVHVLRNLWDSNGDVVGIIARANWLIKQVDIRGWAHRFIPENADDIVRTGRGIYILLLLSPPIGSSKENLNAYWDWAEKMILSPIKEQFPDTYEWLVNFHYDQMKRIVNTHYLESNP